MTQNSWLKSWQNPPYWLMGIMGGIVAIHLTLCSRTNRTELFGTMLLFWGIVLYLLWEKRDQISLESDLFSSLIGGILLGWILLKSLLIFDYEYFLRIVPLVGLVGVGLMASGFKGLKTYYPELIIFLWLGFPPGALSKFFNLSLLTSKTSAFMLHYSGFEVSRQGLFLSLPTGRIEVYDGCAGANIIHQLIGLAIIFLFMFPTPLLYKFILPIIAGLIAFFTNGLRVALMAILVANGQPTQFEYWHQGDGSLLFSMVAVFFFGLFCWGTILRNYSDPNPSRNS